MAVKFRGNTWTNWHKPDALLPEDMEKVLVLAVNNVGIRYITISCYDPDLHDWIAMASPLRVIAWCRLPDLPKESDL